MALGVGGVIGLLSCLLVLISLIALMMASPVMVRNHDVWMFGHLISLAISFPWSVLMLFSGMKILRVESYRLSLAGFWLALLPLSPACLVTIPAGIWGLVIVTTRQARTAYRRKEELDELGEPK